MKKFVATSLLPPSLSRSPAAMAADRTVTLSVKNMDCAACPSIVKASLQAVSGVTKVTVSYKDRTAVTYDDVKADVNQLTVGHHQGGLSVRAQELMPMLLNRPSSVRTARLAKTETMPTDACQFFYECTGCGTKLKPKPGDCCVFCSYGSLPCPPMQAERSGESGAASCCAGR